MNLDRMFLAALIVGLIGWRAGARPADWPWLLGLGLLACLAFTHNGLYWNVFGHGEGPPYFTYNRLSAWALLLALLFGPTLLKTVRR